MEEGVTDFFAIETVKQQGCMLSPMLFHLVINFVSLISIDHLHIGIPWTGGNNLLADLNFADDIIIFGPTQTALRNLTMALENQVASTGFQISGQKTNHLICNSPSLSLEIKLRLLATIVVPMMTYTCESCKKTEAITQKFDYFTSDV